MNDEGIEIFMYSLSASVSDLVTFLIIMKKRLIPLRCIFAKNVCPFFISTIKIWNKRKIPS